MRLELNIPMLIVLLIGSIALLAIYRKQKSRKLPTKILITISISLLLPAFIPGHSEIVIAIPNGALFGKLTTLAWGIGLFFMLVYSWILHVILNKNNN